MQRMALRAAFALAPLAPSPTVPGTATRGALGQALSKSCNRAFKTGVVETWFPPSAAVFSIVPGAPLIALEPCPARH